VTPRKSELEILRPENLFFNPFFLPKHLENILGIVINSSMTIKKPEKHLGTRNKLKTKISIVLNISSNIFKVNNHLI
jgi:hypothetical protein